MSSPALSDEQEIFFEEFVPEGLEHLRFHEGPDTYNFFGAGAALVDIDGDGMLDLLFGAYTEEDEPACVYRNESGPAGYRFAPVPGLCGDLGFVLSGLALPTPEGAGSDLLLLGRHFLALASWSEAEGASVRTLFDRRGTEASVENRCEAGAALVFDPLLTGKWAALVGCQAHIESDRFNFENDADNRLLIPDSDAGLVVLDVPAEHILRDPGNTLALAHVDHEDNGLFDVMVVNDTFSRINSRYLSARTGYSLRRCAPDEGCVFDEVLWADDASAWGSFMGAAEIRVGDERHWYLTDWGNNRLLRWNAEGAVEDRAQELGVDETFREQRLIYSWGALVDDFNGSGRDDLLVTSGHIGGPRENSLVHRNVLFLQTPEGDFERLADGIGLPQPSLEMSTTPGLANSTRAAMKVDLNLDGRLELILLDQRGPPRFLREVVPPDRPLRCNVDPAPRHVHSVGTGYAFAPSHDAPFRTWDVQGQMRFGAPSRLLLPIQQGLLRFPSGAIVPFDCGGTPGPVRVEEPDWLQVGSDGAEGVIRLDLAWRTPGAVDLGLVFLARDPADPLALDPVEERVLSTTVDALAAGQTVSLPAAADDLMLRLDGRWIPLRFALRDEPIAWPWPPLEP